MRALILGAGGQLGRALAAAPPAGAWIAALGRDECDIADPGQVERAIAQASPEIIFNAAAYTAVDEAEANPAEAERVNALAPGVIARAARRAGARTVHVSTDFVFNGVSSTPYRPCDAPDPIGVYARTKFGGEQAVQAEDPGALIVRSAWIYAARGGNFMNTMLRLMRARTELAVVADQIGTPTHAGSLAGALWRLAAAGATGILHYTDAGVASWYDFAVAIEEDGRALGLIERPVTVTPIASADYPARARRPAYSVLDKSDAWRMIGTIPPHWRVNLRAALQEVKADG